MSFDREIIGPRQIFDNLTVGKGTSGDASPWIRLHEYYKAHGVNGKFAGGKLKLEYQVAAVKDGNFGTWQTVPGLDEADPASDSPFLKSLVLDPGAWIRFRATETVGSNDITDLYLYFLQVGG